MIPNDDSRHCYEFDDFYLLEPSILFQTPINYGITANGQKGVKLKDEFEYSSDKNTLWLSKEEILEMASRI